MSTATYRALLRGDTLEWLDRQPESAGEPVEVEVIIPAPKPFVPNKERGARIAAALEALARLDTHSFPEDTVQWQREERRDRPLPGRETE